VDVINMGKKKLGTHSALQHQRFKNAAAGLECSSSNELFEVMLLRILGSGTSLMPSAQNIGDDDSGGQSGQPR
jgi:hypothetical protein